MASEGLDLPIFELPVVILPGELLPLHIFEERYKRMIGHCLDNAEPFGIVFRDEEGNAHRIGCMARVTEVLERFEDGRMNVVVAGEQPFKILERFEAGDFPAGEVDGALEASWSSGSRGSLRMWGSSKPRTRTGSRRASSCRRKPSRRYSSCARSPIGCGCWATRCEPWSRHLPARARSPSAQR
ncbi:MAG: hypothetical protein E6G48_08365 [Actinobacteria bacterium]|nr:MAG: hypothetical protein E6G48_08365 [Actinomycetota bacterium]